MRNNTRRQSPPWSPKKVTTNRTGMSDNVVEAQRVSSQVSIKHCSFCQGTTEYYCHDCKADLCRLCKEAHVDILDIKYHNVTVYSRKIKTFRGFEMCSKHPNQVCELYCDTCNLSVCFHCTQHKQHIPLYLKEEYITKLMVKGMFIRDIIETLYNAQVHLTELKPDFTLCLYYKEITQVKASMVTKSQSFKDSIDEVQSDIGQKNKSLLTYKLQQQMDRLYGNIARIQRYEERLEQFAYRPVQFLRFIKTVRLPQILDTPRLTQHYLLTLTQKINIKDLVKYFSAIQITKEGKRTLKKRKHLLTLMDNTVFHKSLLLTDVNRCSHISFVTPDRVWVSDENILILKDTTWNSRVLYSVKNVLLANISGVHAVNRDGELIFINKKGNIDKLSKDRKTIATFIRNPDSAWTPMCIYCSPSAMDLLVALCRYDNDTETHIGKVMHYSNTGRHTHTIQDNNNTHQKLYEFPRFITRNNNQNVLVSDFLGHAVVVTSFEGNHRFSYARSPFGYRLSPEGICTDALSNILVCDIFTKTVHMLSQDGEFLKYLLRDQSPGIDSRLPTSICYDVNTHCIWVGSGSQINRDNTLSCYRHINRHPTILGKPLSF